MFEIASYKKIKRRNCFKKRYYKATFVLSNEFAQFKRDNKEKNENVNS